MTRSISTSFRNSLESQQNSELILIFATITHPSLEVPVRVVSEDLNGVSFLNGLPVNYKWNDPIQGAGTQMYLGLPFSFTLLTDGPDPPKAQIKMMNVDTRIGHAVLPLDVSPGFMFSLLKLSDFSGSVDSDNARTPLATPAVEYRAQHLFLQNVEGNEGFLTADVVTIDVKGEPCPAVRTTKDICPGLYR